MKRRIPTVLAGLAGLAAVVALVAVPSALAAYNSAKLQVLEGPNVVTVNASLSPDDDPTAVVRISAPTGTQLTTTQAPGTVLGPIHALVKALDLGGADLELDGQLVVAAPGQVSAAAQTQCLQGTTPLATWVMVLSAAGQTLSVPTFLLPTGSAASPALIQVCLPPPDVPATNPAKAPFGAKLYSAHLTIGGVFHNVPVGAWVSTWTPYNPGLGTPNLAGTVAAPAAIAPGAVTLTARKRRLGAVITGRVTQAGQPRGGATVAVFGSLRKTGLKRLGKASVNDNGVFHFTAKRGTYFRATATAAPGAAAPLCTQLAGQLGGVPCVNPTVNGFTAQSKVAKRK